MVEVDGFAHPRQDKHAQAALLSASRSASTESVALGPAGTELAGTEPAGTELAGTEPVGDEPVHEDRLRLIFTCCHPALSDPAFGFSIGPKQP